MNGNRIYRRIKKKKKSCLQHLAFSQESGNEQRYIIKKGRTEGIIKSLRISTRIEERSNVLDLDHLTEPSQFKTLNWRQCS